MEGLLADHTLSWQRECCVSACLCERVCMRVSLLWCEKHFSNHDPVLLSNWIKCDFRLCREGDGNVCDWQYIKPRIHFRKLLTLVLQHCSPLYCITLLSHFHHNELRKLRVKFSMCGSNSNNKRGMYSLVLVSSLTNHFHSAFVPHPSTSALKCSAWGHNSTPCISKTQLLAQKII